MPDNHGDELRPATREELRDSLAFAIRYSGRKRVRDDDADSFMGRAAAERLIEHIRLCGFVVMKKPPVRSPSVVLGPHLPLKD